MARGSNTASTAATQSLNNAGGLFGPLEGSLESEAIAPGGMSPLDIAASDTANEQSAGGAQGAAAGQGALLAARTRNAGTADAAIEESARDASRAMSEGVVNTRLKNASLKAHQQQEGLGGLNELYGENLGAIAPNVNANTSATNASWDWATDLIDPMIAGGAQVGRAALGQ
ncbi:MAG: hypothetical protein WCA44_09130 [Acidobacteriaceae bacterium]